MRQLASKTALTAAFFLFFSVACTDLTEVTPSHITSLQSEEEFVAALGEAYTILAGWQNHGGLFALHEISSDEAVIPQRGPDWFDGGVWLRAHRHTVTPDHGPTNGAWNFLFSGVNATSRLILQFETLAADGTVDQDLADVFVAELKVLRAFYYYWLLDSFGNVPIIDDFAAVEANPPNNPDFQAGRSAVFQFVESQILQNIDRLGTEPAANYGRMHRDAANFLLAKLYLNAQVYTGSARWQDAVTRLDAIINSGNYALEGNYFANFVTNNSGSSETIFAIPYDRVFLGGFNMHHMTLHYEHQATFNFQQQPWNGYATLAEFYNSFEEDDVRREGFMVGPQFAADGSPLIDPVIGSGHHLTIVPEIPALEMVGGLATVSREKGARFNKFEYEMGAAPDLNNDFPVFRYADVLLMKAEALWRMNPGDGQALMLVNQVRQRAGVNGFTQLTADNLLAERGRELYTEIWRRQDLIRFAGVAGGATRFNDPWWEKGVSDATRNVFPIPQPQRDANPALHQNPGY